MRANYWRVDSIKFSLKTCPKTGAFIAVPAPDVKTMARINRQKRKAKCQKSDQKRTVDGGNCRVTK